MPGRTHPPSDNLRRHDYEPILDQSLADQGMSDKIHPFLDRQAVDKARMCMSIRSKKGKEPRAPAWSPSQVGVGGVPWPNVTGELGWLRRDDVGSEDERLREDAGEEEGGEEGSGRRREEASSVETAGTSRSAGSAHRPLPAIGSVRSRTRFAAESPYKSPRPPSLLSLAPAQRPSLSHLLPVAVRVALLRFSGRP